MKAGRLPTVAMLAAAVIALVTAAPSFADEVSQRLYSKGLVTWHANGSAQAAIADFERAVEADPGDALARYYLGTARASAGETAAAIEDLREALRLRPDFPEAAADLGILLLRDDRPAEAEPYLELAAQRHNLRARASLMLGVSRLRLGELDAALVDLRRAAALDPTLAAEARYYEGVVQVRQGQSALARESFEAVIRDDPGSAMAFEARRYLQGVDGGPARPYLVYASVGIDYDSNVTLETDAELQDPQAQADEGDGNVHFRLGGRYRLWGNGTSALTVGYEFFQRLYFDLDEYNLQGHRPGLRFTHRWNDFYFGLAGDYDYFLLQDESYVQRVTALPWVAVQEGDWGRSELSYRFRWDGFFRLPPGETSNDPDDALPKDALDALIHRPILRQYFYVDGPDRGFSIAYVFERRDPVGNGDERFAYTGNGFEVALDWSLPWQLSSRVEYSYEYQDYDEEGRVDQPHQIIVALRRPIAEYLFVTAAYRGLTQDSNQFPYDRHIGSLTMEFVY